MAFPFDSYSGLPHNSVPWRRVWHVNHHPGCPSDKLRFASELTGHRSSPCAAPCLLCSYGRSPTLGYQFTHRHLGVRFATIGHGIMMATPASSLPRTQKCSKLHQAYSARMISMCNSCSIALLHFIAVRFRSEIHRTSYAIAA